MHRQNLEKYSKIELAYTELMLRNKLLINKFKTRICFSCFSLYTGNKLHF